MTAEQAKYLKEKSLEWFLSEVKNVLATQTPDKSRSKAVQKETNKAIETYAIGTEAQFDSSLYGKMILYTYDAKWKDKLPYWDAFPLVFPLTPKRGKSKEGSFLGLNMHYLPPYERAKLLTALLSTINTTKGMSPKSRLRISYQVLEGASKFRLFKPCLKMYLFNHLKSKIVIIDPQHWDKVLMLPIARWQKASEYKVWADSIATVRRRSTTKKKK